MIAVKLRVLPFRRAILIKLTAQLGPVRTSGRARVQRSWAGRECCRLNAELTNTRMAALDRSSTSRARPAAAAVAAKVAEPGFRRLNPWQEWQGSPFARVRSRSLAC
jgi:hypothetical protein